MFLYIAFILHVCVYIYILNVYIYIYIYILDILIVLENVITQTND